MSEVFGSVRHPAYFVRRRDQLGREISLGDELPDSRAILFTGPKGMGKSSELDRAEDLALRNGWSTIRLKASANNPLEHQLTRATKTELDELRDRFGKRPVRSLTKTVGDLTQSGRNTRVGWEGRALGSPLPVELVFKHERDTTAHDKLGTTLNDFADELGRLTELDGKPILLLVDNIDKATETDLAGLNELAIHLEQQGRRPGEPVRPVWLICAGGATSTSALMGASRRMSGIATLLTNQFDIRELGPLSDQELWPALTEPLEAAGIGYEYEAINDLLTVANGDPGRLRDLGEAAVRLADPQDGITVEVAASAAAKVRTEAAKLYDGYWYQKITTNAQKDLLAEVAAQGPNGLFMPSHYEQAGPGRWQDLDEARQMLVARDLLREQPGGVVTISDAGFQDWVNEHLGQTPAPLVPGAPSERTRQEAGLAPAHPRASRALVNQVFGRNGELVHQLDRTDEDGKPISLDERPPEDKKTSVLFTGPAGMGTSHELARVQTLADRQGWVTINVNATRRESIEARIIREVHDKLDEFKKHYTPGEVKELQDLLKKMAVQTKNSMNTAQTRIGMSPIGKVGFHRSWEGVAKDSVGTTLNQLAEHLGKMSLRKGEPILLMVDNLDAAHHDDLVTLTELSAQLKRGEKPLYLIAAGTEEAIPKLLDASGGRAGVEGEEDVDFDFRKLRPLTDAELRPALTEPLRQAGIPYESEAIDNLIAESNGNPTRARILASSALELAEPHSGITVDVAKVANARLNTGSRVLYNAAWQRCTPTEKELLRRTAATPRGITRPAVTEPIGSERWDLDTATHKLTSNGLLSRSGDQIKIADPGFRDWVHTRMSVTAANAGVAPPGTAKPALTPAREQGEGRHALAPGAHARKVGDHTFRVNK